MIKASRLSVVTVIFLAGLYVLGCSSGDGDGIIGVGVVSTIEVTPGSVSVAALGETQQFSAVAKDALGNVITSQTITWTVSAPNVASVDANGLATAQGNGSSAIIASSGTVSGSGTLMVAQAPVTVEIAPTVDTLTAFGESRQYNAVANDARGNPISGQTFSWSSSNDAIANVNPQGLATAVGNGDVMITASANGASGSAQLVVAQQVASVTVNPADASIGPGAMIQFSAMAFDANNNPVAARFLWISSDPAIAQIDTLGMATGLQGGVVTITAAAQGEPGYAVLRVEIISRRPGQIALYRNYDPWSATDTAVLNAPPFNFVPNVGYFIRPMTELSLGIPLSTSLVILPSASDEFGLNFQIPDQNASAAVANLDGWVRGGGWLVVHGADNSLEDYVVPGLLGSISDDIFPCNGNTLTVGDHALVRGPDAVLGTADDLTDANIDLVGSCADSHGTLEGLLPANAEVYIRDQGGDNAPVYATYTLGAGRVIVTSITLEYGAGQAPPLPILRNHFYWAINGLNAPPAVSPYRAMDSAWDANRRSEWLDSTRRRGH